jgi:polyisoprenoid-binding protein YceI
MKTMTLCLFICFVNLTPKDWDISTAKEKIGFQIKGPFGTVNGQLSDLKGQIIFDEAQPEKSSFKVNLSVSTLKTGIDKRDKDLKSASFFDLAKYPLVSFVSKKISKTSSGFEVVGDLTIKNKTKEVTIPFTFSGSGESGTFKGHFTLNRLEYGLGDSSVLVGNTASINIEVPVTKGQAGKK